MSVEEDVLSFEARSQSLKDDGTNIASGAFYRRTLVFALMLHPLLASPDGASQGLVGVSAFLGMGFFGPFLLCSWD